MGFYGRYNPVFCRIYAIGRVSDASFGSEGFTQNIMIGPSVKHSRVFAEIEVRYDSDKREYSLFIDKKLIKKEYQ